jgi:hypothetical protein
MKQSMSGGQSTSPNAEWSTLGASTQSAASERLYSGCNDMDLSDDIRLLDDYIKNGIV